MGSRLASANRGVTVLEQTMIIGEEVLVIGALRSTQHLCLPRVDNPVGRTTLAIVMAALHVFGLAAAAFAHVHGITPLSELGCKVDNTITGGNRADDGLQAPTAGRSPGDPAGRRECPHSLSAKEVPGDGTHEPRLSV
jgi:hypothetical protein